MKTDQRSRIDVEWLGLKRLAHYASTSELTIRGWMHLPVDPLPAVRVGGKILVRRSEADSWLARRAVKQLDGTDFDGIVKGLLHERKGA